MLSCLVINFSNKHKFIRRWFRCAPVATCPLVPIPPLKGDALRRSTVLPYLEAHHYEAERDLANVYFTEHDINGELGAGGEWCECVSTILIVCDAFACASFEF